MPFLDSAQALARKHGLDPAPWHGPAAQKYQKALNTEGNESNAGMLVRTLEEYLDIKPMKGDPFGYRLARCAKAPPPGPFKKVKPATPIVLFSGHYSIELCKQYPEVLWVFGDNMQRTGMGGQAIIRQQPNCIGVATKVTPGNDFFVEGNISHMGTICEDLAQIESALHAKRRVVIPITPEGRISLGCGLAALPYHSPTAYAFLERWLSFVTKNFRTERV